MGSKVARLLLPSSNLSFPALSDSRKLLATTPDVCLLLTWTNSAFLRKYVFEQKMQANSRPSSYHLGLRLCPDLLGFLIVLRLRVFFLYLFGILLK